tara:strand:+ start:656 stop:898 length:243 start_codon:yes stop_codon:yes gene_type:complete
MTDETDKDLYEDDTYMSLEKAGGELFDRKLQRVCMLTSTESRLQYLSAVIAFHQAMKHQVLSHNVGVLVEAIQQIRVKIT